MPVKPSWFLTVYVASPLDILHTEVYFSPPECELHLEKYKDFDNSLKSYGSTDYIQSGCRQYLTLISKYFQE